jgi:trans-aconitate methyltransferase
MDLNKRSAVPLIYFFYTKSPGPSTPRCAPNSGAGKMKKEQKESKCQWDASDYANHSSAQQKWAKELIAKLNLSGNESLLDIGCGDGKVTAEIASYLQEGNVVGIDNSEEMISLATDKFPSTVYPNLSFRRQDAIALSFWQEFDVVFSNAVLHWILDHGPVLKGIYQALKPNGRVLAQMGGKGNASQVVEVVDEIMKTDDWKGYFEKFSFPYGFYSPKEYKPWLQEAGFDIVNLELKPKNLVHENKEKFKGWFRTTWLPYLHRIPVKLREKFIDIVTEKYLERYHQDREGKINTGMQRLEFMATK